MKIIRANPEDAMILTQVAKASKSYWGYDEKQLETWTTELTVTARYVENSMVYKAIIEGESIGFYGLNTAKENSLLLVLGWLFILPEYIGKGIGAKLLKHAIVQAKNANCQGIILEADPNAVGFYNKYDFEIIDQKESSIPGRYLPIMQKKLNQTNF